MLRGRSIPLCLAVLVLFPNAHTHAANSSPWLEVNSAHFTVITDAGDKKGREIALRFEQMRVVFANLLSRDRLHQSVPLTILAFKDDKSYYQLAPLHEGRPIEVPGFLLTAEDQDFIVLNLAENEAWLAVAHDFVLMLLRYNYPRVQSWFDEGLAQFFSSIRVDPKQIEMGSDPATSKEASSKSFTELLNAQPWLALPDLFAMKHHSLTRDSASQDSLYDAESWMVMNYLIHQQKLPETGAYFGLALNRHVPVEDAIKQAYGMSAAELEQTIQDYFHAQIAASHSSSSASRARPPFAEDFPSPIAAENSVIVAKSMPEADVRALYAGVQIRISERRELGLRTLHELANTPTEADRKAEAKTTKRTGEDEEQLPSNAIGNPVAHRMLAWDHIVHGEFEEAFAELRDASALNPGDMWIRYYLSMAKYRMAEARHRDIMGLSNMMLDLKAVLEWYPDMADAYDLLALARNAGGGPSAALQSERAAISLSPRNEHYSFHLAQIYVASKNWDAANTLLDRLKASSDPQIAAAAGDLQSQAAAEHKYGIPMNPGQAAQSKYEPQKSPFDVLEEDAAKRAAGNSTDQSSTADTRSTKFLKGRLLAVDCSKAPAAVVTVSAGDSVMRLHVSDYKSLLLIGADDFSCDWRDVAVTVNYKPGKGREGDLVSLEMR